MHPDTMENSDVSLIAETPPQSQSAAPSRAPTSYTNVAKPTPHPFAHMPLVNYGSSDVSEDEDDGVEEKESDTEDGKQDKDLTRSSPATSRVKEQEAEGSETRPMAAEDPAVADTQALSQDVVMDELLSTEESEEVAPTPAPVSLEAEVFVEPDPEPEPTPQPGSSYLSEISLDDYNNQAPPPTPSSPIILDIPTLSSADEGLENASEQNYDDATSISSSFQSYRDVVLPPTSSAPTTFNRDKDLDDEEDDLYAAPPPGQPQRPSSPAEVSSVAHPSSPESSSDDQAEDHRQDYAFPSQTQSSTVSDYWTMGKLDAPEEHEEVSKEVAEGDEDIQMTATQVASPTPVPEGAGSPTPTPTQTQTERDDASRSSTPTLPTLSQTALRAEFLNSDNDSSPDPLRIVPTPSASAASSRAGSAPPRARSRSASVIVVEAAPNPSQKKKAPSINKPRGAETSTFAKRPVVLAEEDDEVTDAAEGRPVDETELIVDKIGTGKGKGKGKETVSAGSGAGKPRRTTSKTTRVVEIDAEDENDLPTREQISGAKAKRPTAAKKPINMADDLFALPSTSTLSRRPGQKPQPAPVPLPSTSLPASAVVPKVTRKSCLSGGGSTFVGVEVEKRQRLTRAGDEKEQQRPENDGTSTSASGSRETRPQRLPSRSSSPLPSLTRTKSARSGKTIAPTIDEEDKSAAMNVDSEAEVSSSQNVNVDSDTTNEGKRRRSSDLKRTFSIEISAPAGKTAGIRRQARKSFPGATSDDTSVQGLQADKSTAANRAKLNEGAEAPLTDLATSPVAIPVSSQPQLKKRSRLDDPEIASDAPGALGGHLLESTGIEEGEKHETSPESASPNKKRRGGRASNVSWEDGKEILTIPDDDSEEDMSPPSSALSSLRPTSPPVPPTNRSPKRPRGRIATTSKVAIPFEDDASASSDSEREDVEKPKKKKSRAPKPLTAPKKKLDSRVSDGKGKGSGKSTLGKGKETVPVPKSLGLSTRTNKARRDFTSSTQQMRALLMVGHASLESVEQREVGWSLSGMDKLAWCHVVSERASFWWPGNIQNLLRSERPLKIELLLDQQKKILNLTSQTISIADPSPSNILSFRTLSSEFRFGATTFIESEEDPLPEHPISTDIFNEVLLKASRIEARREEGRGTDEEDGEDEEEVVVEEDHEDKAIESDDALTRDAKPSDGVDMNFPLKGIGLSQKKYWPGVAKAYQDPESKSGKGKYLVHWTSGGQDWVAVSHFLGPTNPKFFTVPLGEQTLDVDADYPDQLRAAVKDDIKPILERIIQDTFPPATQWNKEFYLGGAKRDALAKKARFGELEAVHQDAIREELMEWIDPQTPNVARPIACPEYDALPDNAKPRYIADVLFPFAVMLITNIENDFEEKARTELVEKGASNPTDDEVLVRALELCLDHLNLGSVQKWVHGVRSSRATAMGLAAANAEASGKGKGNAPAKPKKKIQAATRKPRKAVETDEESDGWD